MNIIIKDTIEQCNAEALNVMLNVVKNNQNAVIGLATGSTPIGLYKNMIHDHKTNGTSYKNIISVNLDEYIGLGIESDQSYVYFMKDNLFNHIDINPANNFLPNGKAENSNDECVRYTALLNGMPQDIQLLGIGANGHIGFNEPGTSFESDTNIVELQEKTRIDNARFFSSLNEVPTHAITMGIKNILNSKQILVLAYGKNKSDAVFKMIKGDVNESCPASILQNHSNVIVILDKDAASNL